jgi:hypothetical protein
MTRLPYLLPWVRVLLLIRSITSTTWGREAGPEVKPVLRRALGDAPADRPRGLVERDRLGVKAGGLLERGMKLTIPTWLAFVFLGTASFAPVVSLRPGWWVPYYGALLACWVLVSVAAGRSVAREDRKAKRKLARVLRQLQDTKNAEAAETDGNAVRHALAEERLIIVARDEDLSDYIRRGHFGLRRGQFGDETVRVITDRRSTARRLRMKAHIPDRRLGERRRNDIEPLLFAQG